MIKVSKITNEEVFLTDNPKSNRSEVLKICFEVTKFVASGNLSVFVGFCQILKRLFIEAVILYKRHTRFV